MKNELIKIIKEKGLNGMIEFIRLKVSDAYMNGLVSTKDKNSYEVGYKDGKDKGFSDSFYDDITRYN